MVQTKRAPSNSLKYHQPYHPKVDELRYISNSNNAAVTVISEYKLNESVLSIETPNTQLWSTLLRQKKNGGGVVCQIIGDANYIQRKDFVDEIKNIFL